MRYLLKKYESFDPPEVVKFCKKPSSTGLANNCTWARITTVQAAKIETP